MTATAIVAVALVVFGLMLAELWLSRTNERRLRAQGALEPDGDVYRAMAWTYPVCFAAMAAEGVWRAPIPASVAAAGLAVFVAAKALKYWAMGSLGPRWSFRVLVLTGARLVAHGPYAWMRHPNYLGVMGELAGMALLAGAPVSGALSLAVFAMLLRRRIAVEEAALKRQSFTRSGR